jgi:pimeloyl-ACP methyl ester carboxylesterase
MLYRAGKRGAEPVILIHGLSSAGARDWAKVIPELASSYDVWALDLPGFGASDKGNHLYSPSNYVRVLDAVFAERLNRPANIVAHSMGGVIALAYAAAYPDRVRRLVVVDVAGVLHRSVYGEYMGRMMAERKLGSDSPWLDMLSRVITIQAENLPAKGVMSLEQPQVRQRMLRGDPHAIASSSGRATTGSRRRAPVRRSRPPCPARAWSSSITRAMRRRSASRSASTRCSSTSCAASST